MPQTICAIAWVRQSRRLMCASSCSRTTCRRSSGHDAASGGNRMHGRRKPATIGDGTLAVANIAGGRIPIASASASTSSAHLASSARDDRRIHMAASVPANRYSSTAPAPTIHVTIASEDTESSREERLAAGASGAATMSLLSAAGGAGTLAAGVKLGRAAGASAAMAAGACTCHFGMAIAAAGINAAATIPAVQTKWRDEAAARRMARVMIQTALRTTVTRTVARTSRANGSFCTLTSFLAGALDQRLQPLDVLFGQLERILVEQCRHRLRGRAAKERVQHVLQRRATRVLALHGRQVDVPGAILLMLYVPLVLEDAEQRANG